MSKLNVICDFLNECGVDAEIRSDRIAPYVNVGDVKSVRDRMQFWIPDNNEGIEMYVGTDMGKWYSESSKLIYLDTRFRYSFKENKVKFPDLEMAKEFIKRVSELY